MRTFFTAFAISLLVGCAVEHREYALGPVAIEQPEPTPTEPHQPRPMIAPTPVPAGTCGQAAKQPGFYTCADACALLFAGACTDLAAECGLICNTAPPIPEEPVDPCASFGGLELVATPYEPPASCTMALWIEGLCAGNVWAAYCCTTDGEPIGQ